METAELKNLIDEIISEREYLTRELFEELKGDEEVCKYIDQIKGWHKLYHRCWGTKSLIENVAMLAVDRSTSFEYCMSFLPTQIETLEMYILSRASNLATESEHYIILAEKWPFADEETKDKNLKMAIKLAKTTEDDLRIVKYLCSPNILPYSWNIETIKSRVSKAISEAEFYSDVQETYNLVNSLNNGCHKLPGKTAAQLEAIVINRAVKSPIPFENKIAIALLVNPSNSEDMRTLGRNIMKKTMSAKA